MRLEVHSAADFLMNLLRVKQAKTVLPENQLQHFKGSLQSLLVLRFRSHWYPDVPTKGSGFRCIRINGKMDPIVEQAGVAVGLQPRQLRKMLPTELTLWIDPEEVAYRIGENGSICVLYDSASRASPSSDLESTGSGGGGLSSGEEFIMERVGNKLPDLTDGQLMEFLENKTSVMHSSPVKSSDAQQRLNHSLSSEDSNNSQSPPLSPRYQQQQSNRMRPQQQQHQHQQMHSNSQQQQQHLFNSSVGSRDSFMDTGFMYQWEGFSNQQHHLKVRGQC